MKNIKINLLLLAVLSALIYLAGCSQTSNSASSQLVGTWTQTTDRQVVKVNGSVVHDTTVNLPATLTMTSGGSFVTPYYTTTYTVSGSQITVYAPGQPTVIGNVLNIQVLDNHNFQYMIVDSPYGTGPTARVTYDTHTLTR
jgi:hypothetical protein